MPGRVLILILISSAVRIYLASTLELTNDEVNYWTYAVYPSLSYFDHPPMIGFLIRLFTLNLELQEEIFVRLVSIIFVAVSTWLIFLIGKLMKDEQTGWIAALL